MPLAAGSALEHDPDTAVHDPTRPDTVPARASDAARAPPLASLAPPPGGCTPPVWSSVGGVSGGEAGGLVVVPDDVMTENVAQVS